MRVASLSFFLYSLSLVAVVAGQSTQLTDAVTDALTTPTDSSSTDSEPTETSTTETTATSTTTDDEPTTTSTTRSTTTTTSDEETSTTESTSTTSEHTTTTTTTSEPTSTSTSTTSSDNNDDEPTSTATVTTITTTQTIDGTPVATTYTSTNSGASEATESPGLSGSSDNSDSGLSSNQKNIIIGVVVGVGGAILIGAIGVVAWRIRARRRNAQDDDVTDLMSGTAVGSGVREKAPSPAAGGTPFRSTLDQYHNPGPVNAASNF
ncbi:hypothetical protein BJY01DRAFT_37982 [Aspergillus pseudoustus]|uniref:Mid2 domain-containing protein n=1 Tax=Aspergillus pseudoustus TaxID=1810923 RepID=A0ABR4KQ64_9EURO